jgi:ACR3 family arsenite transporter
MAISIWVTIRPMTLKVDFASAKNVGKNPKGLFVARVANRLMKAFSAFGVASPFFRVAFEAFIPADPAKDYLAGAVLPGAAPRSAAVFVWSRLTGGNPAGAVARVATNDLIILVAFTPIAAFPLGVSGVSVPWNTLMFSAIPFAVMPLATGAVTRGAVMGRRGEDCFQNVFVPKFGNIAVVGLLLALVIIFPFRGDAIP